MTQPNIATNPETGVRYYTDDGPLEGISVDYFVPVRDGEATNPAGDRWPLRFGRPFDGTDIRFYLRGEPKIREYDPALFFGEAKWGAIDYAKPKPGGPAGTWEETLEVKRRPNSELLLQVDAARLQANARLYPANEDPMRSVLLAEAIRRDQEGTTTPFLQGLLTQHQALVEAGLANEERAQELRAAILAGQPFDLSAGWTNEIAS